jgi:aminoglycoside 3-N-acetyltransferase
MSEQDAVDEAGDGPATAASLAGELRTLGLPVGGVALVHSSLRSLGWVAGGAQAVVDALLDVLGPTGTLIVPTHTGGLSDPARWQNPPVPEPWWPVIRAEMPAFARDATPPQWMGAIAAAVVLRRDAQRSDHPQVSFAAIGADAAAIVEHHPLADGLGEGSPLARLYERDGLVLLLGVTHGSNTSLHLAEHRSTWPSRHREAVGAPVLVDGVRRWVEWEELAIDEADFEALGAAFGAETGAERVGPVGRATARLMRQRALVDYGVAWLAANRP